MGEAVVITISSARHGLDDGNLVEFDDMKGPLKALVGQPIKMKRVYYKTPSEKQVQEDLAETNVKAIVDKSPLSKVAVLLAAKTKEFPEASKREKQMLNRFALDLDHLKELGITVTMDDFKEWTQGGLVNQKKKPQTFEHMSLEASLTKPSGRYTGFPMVTPQHMSQELW